MSRLFPPSTRAAAALALALSMAAPLAAHAADALRVVRDSGTGELRAPNAAEAAAFEKAEAALRASRAAARVAAGQPPARVTGVVTRHADGTIETSLGEDTHMYSVVRTNEDGALQMDCLPAEAASKFVKSAPKAASAKAANATGNTGDTASPTNATNASKKAAAHVHQ